MIQWPFFERKKCDSIDRKSQQKNEISQYNLIMYHSPRPVLLTPSYIHEWLVFPSKWHTPTEDKTREKKKHMENVFSVLSLFSSGSSGTNEKLLHMYNVMAHICNCQTFIRCTQPICIFYGNSWNNVSTKHIYTRVLPNKYAVCSNTMCNTTQWSDYLWFLSLFCILYFVFFSLNGICTLLLLGCYYYTVYQGTGYFFRSFTNVLIVLYMLNCIAGTST